MNILPKKSWHVGRKENIERVRKDEEQARLEEKRKEEKRLAVEREKRLDALRSKSSSSSNNIDDNVQSRRHVNLFEQEEKQHLSSGQNVEYLEEKRKEKEKLENQFTIYLDQSNKESKPWYASADTPNNEKKRTIIDAEKSRHDPIAQFRSDNKKNGIKTSKTPEFSQSKTIEQLRKERLDREKEERQRLESSNSTTASHQARGRYNSQFHPEFSRDNRKSQYRSRPY